MRLQSFPNKIILICLYLIISSSKTINPAEYIEGNWLISYYLPHLSTTSSSSPQYTNEFGWMISQCKICQKKFKNSTYLNLHILLNHINITRQSISYDKVCRFTQCNSSQSTISLSQGARMSLCIDWVSGELKMGVDRLEDARKVDKICRELISHGKVGYDNILRITFNVIKICLVIATILLTVNYINKMVIKNRKQKQEKTHWD